MATASIDVQVETPRVAIGSVAAAATLSTAMLSTAIVACLLAGYFPLVFSIVTVFLFAGPHNWMEARYLLARMPARWGRLRPYFLLGTIGVPMLVAIYAALPWMADAGNWTDDAWLSALAAWNSAVIAWVTLLVVLRSRQAPRRDWAAAVPTAFMLITATWLWPLQFGLALVYVHPLMALWFLDRELGRQHSALRSTYRRCLWVVPLLVGVLWWRLADAPALASDAGLAARITEHAGATILGGVSSHLLVATHTFLEMLHYGVWLVAIPLVSFAAAPWQVRTLPLARRGRAWRWAIGGVLVIGAMLVLGFWAGFIADYPATRDLYFTVAMLHVLAEVPFLLRLL
ncbi:MAG TPA: hypothetical protein VG713_13080 [Pirellulales bacterium]|nr:hypothetical protein [Pirellulales bacterium]